MKTRTLPRKKEQGFTLVEVMAVMAIIALLAIVVVPNVFAMLDKSKVQKAKADIRVLQNAVRMYRLDMSEYPPQDFGLQALKEAPSGLSNPTLYPRNGYIEFLTKDPWDNDYIYLYPGEHGDFDILSYGSDGQEGGEGLARDIVSWEP